MSPNEYQLLAARTEKILLKRERLQHAILGISSESGELADTIKKHVIYDQRLDVENISEELGDLFWYMAIVANVLDLKFEDIMKSNIEKLAKRYPDRYSDHHAAARLDKAKE